MASTSSLTLSQALLARAISHHHGSNSSSSSSLSTLSMPTLSGLKSLPVKLSTKFFHRSRRSAGFSCQVQPSVAEPATVDKTTDTSLVEKSMNMIRFLGMDAVEKANSGHRLCLPMGCAPMGHILYNEVMRYNPKNPYWFNRDCFVLSTGHGCMLKYAPPRPHIPTVCFALHNPQTGQQPLPQPSSASPSFLLNGIIAIISIFLS